MMRWTLNENHDAELIAKVMKERDRVLAEKEQHSEDARKAFERAKVADKEVLRRKCAELEAGRQQMKPAQAQKQELESGSRCSTEAAGAPDEVQSR